MKRVAPEPNFAAQLENTADYPKTAAIAYTAADLDASLIDAKTDYQNAASDNTGYYLSYLVRLRLWLTKGSRRWEYFIETFAGTSVPTTRHQACLFVLSSLSSSLSGPAGRSYLESTSRNRVLSPTKDFLHGDSVRLSRAL